MTTWSLDPPDTGILFVVSGPSGAGKTTLVKDALVRVPRLTFSVSVTTRAPRAGEMEGRDYRFVADSAFDRMVEQDALLEHATVYERRYGTPRGPVEGALARGDSMLLEIDVAGAAQVRARMPESVHVFVLPPSVQALEERLRARAADNEEVVRRRMAEAAEQLRPAPSYDYVVVNRDLSLAQRTFEAILVAEMSRAARQGTALGRVLRDLPSP
jgi:guanylate kinase